MEAKDTVMSDEELDAEMKRQCWGTRTILNATDLDKHEIQAEISFKAGIEKGHDHCAYCDTPLLHEGELYEAKKAGRREVVECVEHSCRAGELEPHLIWWISKEKWQAKLKEWGIEL